MRLLFIFGTRPEAVKLCPVIRRLRSRPGTFDVRVCVTAQHRAMLDQVLSAFDVTPDHDLNVMTPGQTLFGVTARMLSELEPVMAAERPDWVVVQGDTTSTLCGSLAAFYAGVPLAHVEAGLRTGDMAQPFPEEMNRVLTGRLARLHFAATSQAADNLRREGVHEPAIVVTGNTGIDAVLQVSERLQTGELRGLDWTPVPGRRTIVVTAHRRESFGDGFERICDALATLAERRDVEIAFPVHPNPNVREPVRRRLGGLDSVRLLDPLEYVPFVDLMRRADVLLTDSGGVQEEGPSLGKPVLVMREKTERPEGVAAGTARLVGTDPARIVAAANALLDDPAHYRSMSQARNVYGDGRASERIERAILAAG